MIYHMPIMPIVYAAAWGEDRKWAGIYENLARGSTPMPNAPHVVLAKKSTSGGIAADLAKGQTASHVTRQASKGA